MGAFVEVVSAGSMLVGGAFLLWTLGARGWGVGVWSLAVGSFLTMVVGYLQVVTPLPGNPALTMALVGFVPVAGWFVTRRRGAVTPIPLVGSVVALAALSATVLTHYFLRTFAFHVDSMEYLGIGQLLVDNTYSEVVIPDQIDKRILAVPLLHAPAHLTGSFHMAGITPALAIATIGIVAWLVHAAARPTWGDRGAWSLAGLGVLVLVTMNRFDFHAIYLNGHLYTGLAVLATAGASWLLVTKSTALGRAPVVVAALGCFALVLSRTEGPFLALAAIAPVVAARDLSRGTRVALLAAAGTSITAWYAFATALRASRGYELGPSAPMAAVGVMLVGGAVIVALGRLPRLVSLAPAIFGVGIVGVVLGWALLDPTILGDSLFALYHNAYGWFGSWGVSFGLLTGLVVAALLGLRGSTLAPLRAPVTMFLPIAMLLAYARGSAYRVAAADSLNRMLIEVVPLAVAFVLVALAVSRRTLTATAAKA
jgi:hypothetical protein